MQFFQHLLQQSALKGRIHEKDCPIRVIRLTRIRIDEFYPRSMEVCRARSRKSAIGRFKFYTLCFNPTEQIHQDGDLT
jgi:hypothetical protein